MSPRIRPAKSYPPLLEWLLYSAGDPTERAPDDCSRGRLFDISPKRVNVALGLVLFWVWLTDVPCNHDNSHRHREWQEPSHAEIRKQRNSRIPDRDDRCRDRQTFGLPEGTSFQKFLVERDIQRDVRNDRSRSRTSSYETRYRCP